jgi:hypothetical protein
MKSQYRTIFAFIALLVLVSLACSALAGGEPTANPTLPPQPTAETIFQPPTQQEQTQQQPPQQEPPAIVNQQFFTEEFDAPLSNSWSILTVTGSDKADADKVTVESENGKLSWDFQSEYVYYYIFYNGYEYSDVKLEVRADNRGKNNNSVSLICRYDPNVGWYEFNIANNGLYDILYAEVDSNGNIGYSRITNGGSNAIKQGKDVNEYAINCEGTKLTLTINGKEVNSITESRFGLREGQVGVSVSSFNVLPIQVEMDWIKISEP